MEAKKVTTSDWSILLDPKEFNFFRARLFELTGINLNDSKQDLVQTRLRSRILKLNMDSFASYADYLETISHDNEEWQVFINLLTTNKTAWFREKEHFDYIEREFLPVWEKQGRKCLSVWCSASSTGEEPYSLSLVLHSALSRKGIDYRIMASDIDTRVLSVAQNGVFERKSLELIPAKFHKDFCSGTGEISNWIKIKDYIKEPISFQKLNLSDLPTGWSEVFDLIVCRNVFIYFKSQTIESVVKKFYSVAGNNAVLIIAHAESLQNISTTWDYKHASIYTKGKIYK